MRRPIDVAWYHYNHYIKAREVSPISPVAIPSEAKNPPVETQRQEGESAVDLMDRSRYDGHRLCGPSF